jgi:hypothetical protein
MIKVVRIAEAPDLAEDSGWSIETPYQVIVIDGADPHVHADGRIGLKRCNYKSGGSIIVVGVPAVKVSPLESRYILSTQAMDALARRVDPNARVYATGAEEHSLTRAYEVK